MKPHVRLVPRALGSDGTRAPNLWEIKFRFFAPFRYLGTIGEMATFVRQHPQVYTDRGCCLPHAD